MKVGIRISNRLERFYFGPKYKEISYLDTTCINYNEFVYGTLKGCLRLENEYQRLARRLKLRYEQR